MQQTWAYIGMDEVDQYTAREIACSWGVNLKAFATCERLNNVTIPGLEAMIVSLDCIPRQDHRKFFETILRTCSDIPCVVHGYDLDEELIQDMQDQGMSVFSKLNSRVFAELMLKTEQLIIHSLENSQEETSSVLPVPEFSQHHLDRYTKLSPAMNQYRVRLDSQEGNSPVLQPNIKLSDSKSVEQSSDY